MPLASFPTTDAESNRGRKTYFHYNAIPSPCQSNVCIAHSEGVGSLRAKKEAGKSGKLGNNPVLPALCLSLLKALTFLHSYRNFLSYQYFFT